MAVYSVRASVAGFTGRRLHLNLENYRYLWDPLYGEVFTAHARAGARSGRVATLARRLPARVLPRPLRAAQDAAAAARHRPVLDELPDPHVLVADHPRPRVPAHPRAATARVHRTLRSSTRTKAIYIGVVYNYLPLMILPLYAALERMDWSLVDAAQDLGDSAFRAFRRGNAAARAARDRGRLAARLHPADGRVPDPGDPRRRQDASTPAT